MILTRWQQPVGYGLVRTKTWNDELEELFQNFGSLLDSPANSETQRTVGRLPAVDLYENKDTFTVKAELPGLKKDDIDISLRDGFLVLSGEFKELHDASSGRVSRTERRVGRFQRAIRLGSKVNGDAIKAAYTDGILIVELPKAEEAKPKQIKIAFN
jgi:HSP20 family protein